MPRAAPHPVLEFGTTLLAATFIRRPHRFCTVCRLDQSGVDVDSHLADPGRLREVLVPGARLYLAGPFPPPRKLRYSTVLAEVEGTYINLVSTLPNTVFPTLLEQRMFPGLTIGPPAEIRREVRCDRLSTPHPPGLHGRFDFEVHDSDGSIVVEVKGVTLSLGGGRAAFPDAPSARARRHLEGLIQIVRAGGRAALVFVVGRADIVTLEPAGHIDPDFARLLPVAVETGVQLHACGLTLDLDGARDPYSIQVCPSAFS